jgi:branched-chain amino acid transport system substrate-binding protein
MKKVFIIIGVIVVVAIGVFVWLDNDNNGKIKIGVILPLTGERSLMGELGKKGLLLAQTYLNDSIFKDEKIHLIVEDGGGVPTKSLNCLHKLLYSDKTDIIFSIVSGVDFAILPIQAKENFLFVSHTTHPALSGVNNMVFRHSPTLNQELNLITQFSTDLNNIFIFMNDEYSVPLKDSLINRGIIKKDNCISFDKNTTDFMEIVLMSIKNQPSKIIVSGTGAILADLINKLRDFNYKGEILTTLGFAVTGAVQLVKDKNNLLTINFANIVINDKFSSLISEFQSKEERNITPSEVIFFNSLYLIGMIINNGATTNENIALNLSQIKNFQGLGEILSVNSKNDIEPSIQIIKY